MTGTASPGRDWDPTQYGRFADLRLRPALDLLGGVPALPPGDVVDLGCGDGAVGHVLAGRFPDRELVGLDTSPAMLEVADERGVYGRLIEQDAATWTPDAPPALVFSNSALHWIRDHDVLIPRLAGLLVPGGTLAVQMPAQYGLPSHDLFVAVGDELFPGRFGPEVRNTIPSAVDYERMLAPLGTCRVWDTTYVQRLAPLDDDHPVRAFTASTALRPYVERMTEAEAARFNERYRSRLEDAYPPERDGTVLFPFRRRFFTLTV